MTKRYTLLFQRNTSLYALMLSLIFSLNFQTARAQGPGTALDYDGSFQFTTMPNGIVQNLSGSFTIEAWVYWRGGSATWGNSLIWQRIIDFGNDQNNYVALVPQSNYNSQNGVMFWIALGGSFNVLQSTTPLPVNTWTHIAATVDNATNTANLYVGGTLAATTPGFTFRPSSLGATVNNWLGKSEYAFAPAFDPFFNGIIDELRISNTVRYTADFTPVPVQFATDGNTTALYHFNEGSGQVTADASGNFGDAIRGADVTVDATTDPSWITNSILPIKLTDFSVSVNKLLQVVDVKWTAATDAPSDFIIERSGDGSHFSALGRVSAPNVLQGLQQFSFRDNQPLNGRSYYRLKAVELGQEPVYSGIAAVSIGLRSGFLVYPNPLTGSQIRIELDQPFSGTLEIAITNASGHSVFLQKIQSVSKREFQLGRPTVLVPGVYFVEIGTNGFRQSQVLIVQ